MAANDLQHTNSASTTLNLNDGNVYSLLEPGPAGIWGTPAENVTQEVPARLPRRVLVATQPVARDIQMPLLVQGDSRPDLITNLAALATHLRVDAKASAYGVLQYESDSGAVRAYRVMPVVDSIDRAIDWLRSNPSARGWARIELTLQCLDHTCYNPTLVEPAQATLSGVANVNISCANAGDEDAYIVQIVVAATATNLKLTDANGVWLQFTDAVVGAETLTIKLAPWDFAITHSVDGDLLGKRVTGSGVPKIKAGTNNLVATGGDAGDDGTLDVDFYSTHGSHS